MKVVYSVYVKLLMFNCSTRVFYPFFISHFHHQLFCLATSPDSLPLRVFLAVSSNFLFSYGHPVSAHFTSTPSRPS